MLDIFKFLGKKQNSKEMAKDRLKLLLIHDRANVSPEFLETIKDEIMQVLEKYMDVAESGLDIQITTTEGEDGHSQVPALTANIPIKNMKKRN